MSVSKTDFSLIVILNGLKPRAVCMFSQGTMSGFLRCPFGLYVLCGMSLSSCWVHVGVLDFHHFGCRYFEKFLECALVIQFGALGFSSLLLSPFQEIFRLCICHLHWCKPLRCSNRLRSAIPPFECNTSLFIIYYAELPTLYGKAAKYFYELLIEMYEGR